VSNDFPPISGRGYVILTEEKVEKVPAWSRRKKQNALQLRFGFPSSAVLDLRLPAAFTAIAAHTHHTVSE